MTSARIMRDHLAELPLRARAEAQVGDVQELQEVHRDLEVGVGGVGQDEAGVFGRHAGLDHRVVERRPGGRTRAAISALHAGALDRLGHRVGELAALEGDVALALLLEADAHAVADELVAEGARDAGDAELEPDLLQRRGVAGLQARRR